MSPVIPTAPPIFTPKAPGTPDYDTQIAKAVHVYVLGEIGSPPEKQLDIYSGLTGYHIRTIPGTRWNNPVIVGAGSNYIAMVDRFDSYDLIRVTDVYAGAGPAGFEDTGFPKDSVDWSHLSDIRQIATPAGYFCTGLRINHYGMLIAGLSSPDGKLAYLKADIRGTETGVIVHGYEGLVGINSNLLPQLGLPIGPPIFPQVLGESMNEIIGICTGALTASAVVYRLDFISGEINGLLGLPLVGAPMGIAYGNSTISILMGLNGVSTHILRFSIVDSSLLFSGAENATTQAPYSYPVTHTFEVQDFPAASGASLTNYLEAAEILQYETILSTFDDVQTRDMDATTSEAANENRVQIAADDETGHYGQIYSIPVSVIELPEGMGLVGLEGSNNIVAELYNKWSEDDTIDTEKPIFRLLHASHYDWLSEGGYTYGCALEGGGNSVLTNGLIGLSIATDRGADPGSLKPLPDLKVAILDSLTGRFIYRYPKPLGVKAYGGDFATLAPANETSVVPTVCTDEAEQVAEAADGLTRPDRLKSETSPEAFANSQDLDFPWEYYTRRALLKPPKIGMLATESSWSSRDEDGVLLPEWDLPTPITLKTSNQLMYPGGNPTTFTGDVAGGLFSLTLPKQQSTNHAEWAKDIQAIGASSASLQAEIDSGNLDDAGIALRQAQISSNATQIASKQAQILATDEETIFVTPRWLTSFIFSPLEASTLDVVTPYAAPAWTVQPLGISPKNRACVITPTVHSWIEVTYRLERTGYFIDGVAGYDNPTARANGGLGINVGPSKKEYSWHDDGYTYESGYIAANGASGRWEVRVLGYDENGQLVPLTKVTFPEQIDMAPAEIQSSLTQVFYGHTPDVSNLIKTGSEVYFSPARVVRFKIIAELVNYAYYVHRIGWRTTQPKRLYDPRTGCMGTDMGVKGPNTCEAVDCGNIRCSSNMFYTHKLFASDPVQARTRQVLWHGEVEGNLTSDPYKDLGLSYGVYMAGVMTFDLNGPMLGYNVDISQNG